GDAQLAEAGIEPSQERVQLFGDGANVEAFEVGDQLLDLAGHAGYLRVSGLELMQNRRWRIRHHLQADKKDTRHQTLGVKPRAESMLNEVLQPVLAELKMLIRF